MNKISTTFGMLLGLALLFAILAAIYYLYEYVIGLFGTMEPQLKTIMTIVVILSIFCSMIIAGGFRTTTIRNASPEKIALYQRVLALNAIYVNKKSLTEEGGTHDELVELEQQLALLGSQKVIAAYSKLRQALKQGNMPGEDENDLLKNLLMTMREDIGQEKSYLTKNDMVDFLLGKS